MNYKSLQREERCITYTGGIGEAFPQLDFVVNLPKRTIKRGKILNSAFTIRFEIPIYIYGVENLREFAFN